MASISDMLSNKFNQEYERCKRLLTFYKEEQPEYICIKRTLDSANEVKNDLNKMLKAIKDMKDCE